jgi:regulator of sigma E protease
LDDNQGMQRDLERDPQGEPQTPPQGQEPANDARGFRIFDHLKGHPGQAHAPASGAAADKTPPEEAPITSRDWWVQNGPILGLVFALLVYLFMKFDSDGLVAIAKAALGLSLVVFLHELGHFLAAKWCDVHVTTFSIGFGPAIPGCSFKWGETTYKLALFPLGGYVQMVGQVDGDESSDGSEDDPRSFRNKRVGQRMLIISAGVIMNVILAVVCFIVVFRGPGKDRIAGVIGSVEPGAPAFKYGLRSGAEILQIGDIKDPYFENLMVRVMANLPGEKIEFVAKRPGDPKPLDFMIQPRNDSAKGDKNFVIGLRPPDSADLWPKRYGSGDLPGPVTPGSASARATPAFEFGDKVVATTDPDNPDQVKDLPDDPRFPGHGRRDYFELMKRLQQLAGRDIIVRVQRGDGKETVDVKLPPSFYQTLGVRMQMGHITNIRDGSPAARAGVQADRKNANDRLLRGDLIQKVEVKEPDGSTTAIDANLDPERLPFDLRQWADRLAKANVPGPWQVVLTVKRHNDFGEGANPSVDKTLELEWDKVWRFDRILPTGPASPEPIPELGLAYQIKSIVADVIPGLVADTPLQRGDAIREMRVFFKDPKTSSVSRELKDEGEQWAQIAYSLQIYPAIDRIALKVWRNQKLEEVTVVPVTDRSHPTGETGLIFMPDTRRQKASSTAEAISLGFGDTWDSMKQVFQNLRGIVIGTISADRLGGPLTIANVAYKIAGTDFWEFVFFLGLISVNLAVINFLPIPVLDGGHMVFLLYEKVRGKPASEGVRVGATYAGLALILCLMIFVLYLDISRLL